MKRFFHRQNRKIWIVFLIALLISLVVLPQLPDRIPIHFDATGTADNYGSKWTIFLFPGIIFILLILAEVLRKIDPKSSSYQRFETQYYTIHFAVSLLMVGVQLLTIGYTFGFEVNISRIMPVIMGLLFIFLGNIMPKFKHNYFVGIRTSWTLASEQVWYLTHRLTGKVWVAGGIVILLTAFLPLDVIWVVFMVVIAVLVIVPLVASYYFFRKYEQ